MANTKMVDIARAAGVSLATVGRVLHNNGYVSEDKRREIERIIKETGYIPNKMAQGLKSNKSKIIGHLTVFNKNMLYEQISEAVNLAASEKGYQVLTLTAHRELDQEQQQIDELIGHQVDGVIITSNSQIETEQLEKLTQSKIPVVMIERTLDLPGVDRIIVEDYEGAYGAVRHMLDQNHTRIGYIGVEPALLVEQKRYQGYKQALADAGIDVKEAYVQLTQYYTVEDGYRAAEKLLGLEEPPTAIFMASDIYACGVSQYCYAHGLNISKDVSLVGYDNTLSTLLAPPITSIGLPCNEIGEQAIDLLLKRMVDPDLPSQERGIHTVLVDRHTVKMLV